MGFGQQRLNMRLEAEEFDSVADAKVGGEGAEMGFFRARSGDG